MNFQDIALVLRFFCSLLIKLLDVEIAVGDQVRLAVGIKAGPGPDDHVQVLEGVEAKGIQNFGDIVVVLQLCAKLFQGIFLDDYRIGHLPDVRKGGEFGFTGQILIDFGRAGGQNKDHQCAREQPL